MKTVILCGGLGTRLSEETTIKPKPMVSIGEHPILWHIMNLYWQFGFNEFVLALGYKGEVIKDYFLNYHARNSDFTIDLSDGKISYIRSCERDWVVNLVDTGQHTLTGGRLARLKTLMNGEETFMLTYGDGLANINIPALLDFHYSHGKAATITAVRPPARFGTMLFDGDQVVDFHEKPQTGEGWINGGFFVFNQNIFDYLSGDETILEKSPLENLARDGELMAYKHEGFWQCMDTLRDQKCLEKMWVDGNPLWCKPLAPKGSIKESETCV